ncbi:hypothetical protein SS50377_20173 [Spironucleus salmonicida]|uniref:Uncharacterized protein n=1 Tax=Spironucleus salmonicida TaxID=348837 RepID=V6LLY5_9EUKA|nr:hypothetical protein SS50377_20173 [Spironucleus salmonicida]|eukprot:EST45228.1 Hypothetical protein SS50377_14803 [Spironucleus salmonicida]
MAFVQMKTKETFEHAIKTKIENDLTIQRDKLDKSILGTIKSSHLNYKSYNLDMQYIMHEKVQEYKKEKSKPYSQFVTGMVPDKILKDLNKLELQQNHDKQYGKKQIQKAINLNDSLDESNSYISPQLTSRTELREDMTKLVEDANNDMSVSILEIDLHQHETASQRQTRKWKELQNNSVDFITSNKQNEVYKMILEWSQ